MFAFARSGADGVNIHTFPGARYGLFTFRRAGAGWSAFVHPEYYGLLMFARAAPPGSRLLFLTRTGTPEVRSWATRASDGRIRLVLINDDVSHSHVVSVRLPERAPTVTLRAADGAERLGEERYRAGRPELRHPDPDREASPDAGWC